MFCLIAEKTEDNKRKRNIKISPFNLLHNFISSDISSVLFYFRLCLVSEIMEKKERKKKKMEVLNFENFNGWKLTEGKSCIQLILGTTILGRKTSFFLSFSLSLNFQKKKKKTEQLYLNFLVCHGFVLSVAIFNFFLKFFKDFN